ncbi:MAG: phosphotransferase, partial [Chloroflexota bacterium]
HRYLIHGDYDYSNVLAENRKVTAVLDWEQVRYGDFVYDIAYLDFYRSSVDLASRFREFYAENGMNLTHFDERFACYTIWMGLTGMKFFAKTDSLDGYRMSRKVVEKHLPQ